MAPGEGSIHRGALNRLEVPIGSAGAKGRVDQGTTNPLPPKEQRYPQLLELAPAKTSLSGRLAVLPSARGATVSSMVKQLVAKGLKGRALTDEVMRLTGLPHQHAQVLINVELTGQGDTEPPLGPAPDLMAFLRRHRKR